jgi:hypothetical protein
MTLKETILHELETADDLLLEDLLQVIRWGSLSGRKSRKHTAPIVGVGEASALAEASRNGDRSPNHPLRGIPIVVPADFNEPMTESRW